MDSVSRSALMSGMRSLLARRWYHSVDLPEPLWPASTKAGGFDAPSSDCFRSLSRVGGERVTPPL